MNEEMPIEPDQLSSDKGRPSFRPTEEERALVESLAAIGTNQDKIALLIRDGIDVKTLRKHFGHQLQTGKTRAVAKIAGKLYNKALQGDLGAQIFFLKTQGGWSEKQRFEHSGGLQIDRIERVIIHDGERDDVSSD